jgi:hypothetical protein
LRHVIGSEILAFPDTPAVGQAEGIFPVHLVADAARREVEHFGQMIDRQNRAALFQNRFKNDFSVVHESSREWSWVLVKTLSRNGERC